MPKLAEELSRIAVKRLKRPGFHAVGGVSGPLLAVKGYRRAQLGATDDGEGGEEI